MGKGQLLFKGDKPKKKKKKSKLSSNSGISRSAENLSDVSSRPIKARLTKGPSPAVEEAPAAPTVRKGTGKITTSGTVVTGLDTVFRRELDRGDAILCELANGREELRVVNMLLSDGSLNLSSAFSMDVKMPASFTFIRKPRDRVAEAREARKKSAETKKEQQAHAFDLYGNDTLVYREKTETGSYRIKREKVDTNNSRVRLLELRTKKTSDKYCY